MKFSYNWIRELVDGLDLAPLDLERLITMKTAECEGLEEAGALLAGACAARVIQVEEIAGSENRKAVVETDRYGVKTVVCGAPNCRPGLRTVYVPVGRKTVRGVESDGMLASGAELGINRDHGGVLELEGVLGLQPDQAIEIDNKSINHRPDLWGHHGMAREVAAISGKRLRDPVRMDLLPGGEAAVRVEIEDLDLCPRYSALVFENVTVRPSPLWLQYRLQAIGLNPINNIVDFTNFVMAELAQPTHAFDRDLLKGPTIYIRPARRGEPVAALNGETYALDERNLVIADPGGAIAIAGVIGGGPTAIHGGTRSIVLESANFQAASIRRTSTQLKLRTDASMRFEKSQDPVNTTRALARAVELLAELSPGIRLVGGLADAGKPLASPSEIGLPLDWLARKLGRRVETAEVRRILESLGFGVAPGDGKLTVSVPSWRATKDIEVKDDLVEEVGRMVGYESIPPVAPLVPTAAQPDDPERGFLRRVRAALAAQGFTEVYNYSFVSQEQARELGFNPADHVAVANPIASDQGLLRISLLPGILKNIRENSRHFSSFRLFEVGREIHPREGALPDEIPHLAAAVYARDDGQAGLLEIKRAAECLLRGATIEPCASLPYEHPARSGEIHWRGERVGRLFEMHPSLLEG
ncbi:MAG: phenylalanine--tRNA ligase subunit beta, partial [Candidatus Solibacter usitatus]|nr:phenylalanine--tRNA ligase subunit beta [Candidatus Solibacter usitatus]